MRRKTHTHPCDNAGAGCPHRIHCDGTWERNYDGMPEAVCDLYHLTPQLTWECDECKRSRCDDCGSVTRLEPHATSCSRRAVEARA